MKIQCDVCSKNQASLFCTADEAALCDACDHRVHHANKLASKHQRFSLHHPSAHQFPLCDVCQEKRAFVFCQQDRAILCKECDLPIHSANEHTKSHSRFLLTGIKLSASASTPHPSLPPSNPKTQSCSDKNSVVTSSCNAPQPVVAVAKNVPSKVSEPPNILSNKKAKDVVGQGHGHGGSFLANEDGAGFTSSISEYLTKTIPGWQVEDFLDSPSVPFGFSKGGGGDDYMLTMFDAADVEGMMGSLTAKSMGGIWVPLAPSSVCSAQIGQQIGYREAKEANNIKGSSRSRLLGDDNFVVPQMSTATATVNNNNNDTASSKRTRLLW